MRFVLFAVLFVVGVVSGSSANAGTYDQTITPYQSCGRPFTCTFTFTDAISPGTAGTLSVVGQGDIDSPAEYAFVYDEGHAFIDYAWDFTCPEGWQGSCTDSMTVSLDSLSAWWSDGNLSFSFYVPADNGLSGVTFQSLRLTYEGSAPNPVPTPGTFGLLAAGVAALGLVRRKGAARR